ncbi:hypothetical protein TRVL_04349 [Trypanosoma vivax]|nr:hypothetical protein TRVL_04349 [Trypanosoma vivax]
MPRLCPFLPTHLLHPSPSRSFLRFALSPSAKKAKAFPSASLVRLRPDPFAASIARMPFPQMPNPTTSSHLRRQGPATRAVDSPPLVTSNTIPGASSPPVSARPSVSQLATQSVTRLRRNPSKCALSYAPRKCFAAKKAVLTYKLFLRLHRSAVFWRVPSKCQGPFNSQLPQSSSSCFLATFPPLFFVPHSHVRPSPWCPLRAGAPISMHFRVGCIWAFHPAPSNHLFHTKPSLVRQRCSHSRSSPRLPICFLLPPLWSKCPSPSYSAVAPH